jgi:DNA-binding winged helix-turn-helix (wHTH) protein
MNGPVPVLIFEEYVLVPATRRLLRGGVDVPITPKVFDLLVHFASNPGRVVTKDELVDEVWSSEPVTDNNIGQHVFALRRTLGQAAHEESLIKTVHRRGFLFSARVERGMSALENVNGSVAAATALEFYRNAQYFFGMATESGLRSAIALTARAIEIQPEFARAHALMALANVRLADWMFARPQEVMPAARESALRALEADPHSSDAHAALAGVQLYFDYDPVSAHRSAVTALECDKANRYAHITRTWCARILDNETETANAINDARASLQPDAVRAIESAAYYFRGDFLRAIDHVEPLLLEDPNRQFVRYVRGASHLMIGDYADAIADLERIRAQEILPLTSGYADLRQRATAVLMLTYARAGHPEKARVILRDLERARQVRHISDYGLAIGYGALKDRAAMYRCLDRALENRDPWLVLASAERFLEEFESEPEFGPFLVPHLKT